MAIMPGIANCERLYISMNTGNMQVSLMPLVREGAASCPHKTLQLQGPRTMLKM